MGEVSVKETGMTGWKKSFMILFSCDIYIVVRGSVILSRQTFASLAEHMNLTTSPSSES